MVRKSLDLSLRPGPESVRSPWRSLAAMQSLLLDVVTICALAITAAVVWHRLRLTWRSGLPLAGVIPGAQAQRLCAIPISSNGLQRSVLCCGCL